GVSQVSLTLNRQGTANDKATKTIGFDKGLFRADNGGVKVYGYVKIYFTKDGEDYLYKTVYPYFYNICSPPLNWGFEKLDFFTEKGIYAGGENMKVVFNFKNSGTRDYPETSVVEFIAKDSGGGIFYPPQPTPAPAQPLTAVYPVGAVPVGQERNVEASISIPENLLYIINFEVLARFKTDDSATPAYQAGWYTVKREIGDWGIGFVCVPLTPEVLPGDSLASHICTLTEDLAVQVTPRLFLFERLEKRGNGDYILIRDSATGRTGVLASGSFCSDPASGCPPGTLEFTFYYTPAVTSMSPDPIPVVLLLLLAASLTGLTEARLRRMRLEKEGKHKKKAGGTKKKTTKKKKKA
ncbi:MAG: hypothetical protein JXB14_02145, partial [Candidatus Altiarchaeota archaeon]|nr:hypothetical protein [Candidatus Altiarchaeota archaeon]